MDKPVTWDIFLPEMGFWARSKERSLFWLSAYKLWWPPLIIRTMMLPAPASAGNCGLRPFEIVLFKSLRLEDLSFLSPSRRRRCCVTLGISALPGRGCVPLDLYGTTCIKSHRARNKGLENLLLWPTRHTYVLNNIIVEAPTIRTRFYLGCARFEVFSCATFS